MFSVEERISTIYEKTSKMDKRSNEHGRKTQQGNWDFVENEQIDMLKIKNKIESLLHSDLT